MCGPSHRTDLDIGYNQGVFSGIVRNDDFLSLLNYPSSGVLGIIVAIYNLGCLFGTVVAFVVSDRLGFRKTMWFSMAWIIVRPTMSNPFHWKNGITDETFRADWSQLTGLLLFPGPDARVPLY